MIISTTFYASASRSLRQLPFELGKLFGDGAGVWVRMQAAYDTWHAEREEVVSGIPTLHPRAAKLERCSGTLQRRQALAVIGAPRVSAVALS